jgi:hypothetical protein
MNTMTVRPTITLCVAFSSMPYVYIKTFVASVCWENNP